MNRLLLFILIPIISINNISCQNRTIDSKEETSTLSHLLNDVSEYEILHSFNDYSVKNNFYVKLAKNWNSDNFNPNSLKSGRYGKIIITDKADEIIDIIELSATNEEGNDKDFLSFSYSTNQGDENLEDYPTYPYNFVIADLNNDGREDIIFSRKRGHFDNEGVFYLQNESNRFIKNQFLTDTFGNKFPIINTDLSTLTDFSGFGNGWSEQVYKWDSNNKEFKQISSIDHFGAEDHEESKDTFFEFDYVSVYFKDLFEYPEIKKISDNKVELSFEDSDMGGGLQVSNNVYLKLNPKGLKDIEVTYQGEGVFVLFGLNGGRLLLPNWKKLKTESTRLYKDNNGFYKIPNFEEQPPFILESVNVLKKDFYNEVYKNYSDEVDMIEEHKKYESDKSIYDFTTISKCFIKITAKKVLNNEKVEYIITSNEVI